VLTLPSGDIRVDCKFPLEMTKAYTREQVTEAIRKSGRYMQKAIGTTYLPTLRESVVGCNDPSDASIVFILRSVGPSDKARVIKDVQYHWDTLMTAILTLGDLGVFCTAGDYLIDRLLRANHH
jgi:hypothetical protein